MFNSEPMPTSEAADQLGVDVRTIHRWVEAGRLKPLVKAPGKRGAYLFDRAEIDRVKAEVAA